MSIDALGQRIATVSDLLCTLNLIVWDSRTMMPPGGTDALSAVIGMPQSVLWPRSRARDL